VLDAIRGFVREAKDKSLTARAALLGGAVAASGRTPDHAAVVELLEGFETCYPDARDLHSGALELRLGEAELHEPARGIVDVDEQCADRAAVFEPGVLAAVELHELAEAGAAFLRWIAAAGRLEARDPEAGADHPAAEGFDGAGESVLLGELLLRDGGPEVGVALAQQLDRLLAERGRQSPAAGSTAALGDEGGGPVMRERSVEPTDLSLAQREKDSSPRRVRRRSAMRVMVYSRSSSFMESERGPGIPALCRKSGHLYFEGPRPPRAVRAWPVGAVPPVSQGSRGTRGSR
jgi:hypothetical protein